MGQTQQNQQQVLALPPSPPLSFNWRQAVVTGVGVLGAGAALVYAAKASLPHSVNWLFLLIHRAIVDIPGSLL